MRRCGPSTAAELYSSTICNLMAQQIPHSTITIKPGDQPWFNGDCRRACQGQHQAYLKMRCQPDEGTKQDYLHAKQRKQQVIDRAKRSHSQRIRSKLSSPATSSCKWWWIRRNLQPEVRVDDPSRPPQVVSSITDTTLHPIQFTPRYIKKQLETLDTAKAMGPDNIRAIVLKTYAPELAAPLAKLLKYSYNTGIYLTMRKIAQVCPAHKKQDKSNLVNYCPISLLLIISKVMEGVINSAIKWCYLLSSDIQF
eukprot:g30694.t1